MALFNWAFAKSQGGEFLVRIEDTDRARSTPASEQAILDALRWLDIPWDEGPDVGGAHGPYRQSERLALYQQKVSELVSAGHAFTCFCTPERLETMRADQRSRGETTRYDGRCAALTVDEVSTRTAAGEAHVVRLRVPDDGDCVYHDRLRGELSIPWAQVDMQVLLKADGYPTYHLAVVVDDHLMGITHILRGEEWLASVPKHQRLYECFGWEMPELIHLPLLRNPDKSKLSKRKNPTSVDYYRAMGYLPDALVNYLARMGWSMPDEREVFTKEDMRDAFDVSRVSLGGPIFDIEKLNWLNGEYLRALSEDAYMDRVAQWLVNPERLRALVPLLQPRAERLADLAPHVDYLLGERATLNADDFDSKDLSLDDQRRILAAASSALDALRTWDRDALVAECEALAAHLGFKLRVFLTPLFRAVAGKPVSLPLFDSMVFLGPDITRMRIRSALRDTVGLSKKQAKAMEKVMAEYRSPNV